MLLALQVQAQDQIFSQFYNAPIYLNPALTGQFEGDFRVTGLYRNQWTGLSGDFSYINAATDLNLSQYNSGVGLSFNRSSEGTAFLSKTNIAASYAYIIGGEDYNVSFGLQTGLTNRKIDWDKLVFGDQIDVSVGYIPGSISGAERPAIDSKFYFDAAAGFNVVAGNFMLGVGMHHINRPDESLSGLHVKLPIRTSVNASYRVAVIPDSYNRDGAYLIPSVVAYKQGNIQSYSIGSQFKYRGVNAGVWFRSNGRNTGNDAIVFSLIFDIFSREKNGDKIRLGISHDATTSRLNYTNTGGTSEIGVGYEKYFPNSTQYNRYNGVRCYDFY